MSPDTKATVLELLEFDRRRIARAKRKNPFATFATYEGWQATTAAAIAAERDPADWAPEVKTVVQSLLEHAGNGAMGWPAIANELTLGQYRGPAPLRASSRNALRVLAAAAECGVLDRIAAGGSPAWKAAAETVIRKEPKRDLE